MNIIEKNQSKIKEFAESIAYHYVYHNSYPRVFIYEGELYFDTNSSTFGTSAIIFNNEKECTIIFDREELNFCLEDLDVNFEEQANEEIEEEVRKRAENRLEQIIELYEDELI